MRHVKAYAVVISESHTKGGWSGEHNTTTTVHAVYTCLKDAKCTAAKLHLKYEKQWYRDISGKDDGYATLFKKDENDEQQLVTITVLTTKLAKKEKKP